MMNLRLAVPVAVLAAGIATYGANVAFTGSPASAQTSVIHVTDNVNIRQQPTVNSARIGGIAKGTALTGIDCAMNGQNINGVSVWMHGTFNGVTGFFASYYDDSHYKNWAELQANYGIPQCGTPAAAAPATVVANAPAPAPAAGGGASVNGLRIGTPTGPIHGWGPCQVRDYTGASYGHLIVSYTAGRHVVRNGMLWGWYDNGGAPGALGCPTSDEYGFGGGARQDFQHGSLVWAAGLDHATVLRSGPAGVANSQFATWMLNRVGQYLGQCRQAADDDVWAVAHLTLGATNANEQVDYTASYRRLGAYQVPVVGLALPGDIVNVGNAVHTYIVVKNLGGGRLDVVDSNHLNTGIAAHYIRDYNYNNYATMSTIWRLGQI